MHILHSVVASAATGAFDARLFWTFFRARRNNIPYLRKLVNRLEADGRPRLAAMVALGAGERLGDAKMLKRGADLRAIATRNSERIPAEEAAEPAFQPAPLPEIEI
jgi:hypothetical protein